jgi:hypothetical protein
MDGSSPDIIRMIKTRRRIFSGHAASTGEIRNEQKYLVGEPEDKDHSEDYTKVGG